MNIAEINSSEKAKKKIKSIAKANHLDYDLVYAIFSFHWNYDGVEGNWVTDLIEDTPYHERYHFICEKLGLNDKVYSKQEVIDLILNKLNTLDKEQIFNNFLIGATTKNYCAISYYASYHYLTNANPENLDSLVWKAKDLNQKQIIFGIFCKIFRAGSVDRDNLGYLFSDLVIDLPFENQPATTDNWTENFIKNINTEMSLSDLIKSLKDFCKGDKYFLQTILEALSYSGILQVKNHPTADIFIPDYRGELSSHFFSNEWSYPLRFWNE